ncbi:MAG: hypothetical protein JNM93_11825 [Bacteriovoracaceae bacterium]|nr:hypothetical protein [Bacteriovoracaceae bacterium]
MKKIILFFVLSTYAFIPFLASACDEYLQEKPETTLLKTYLSGGKAGEKIAGDLLTYLFDNVSAEELRSIIVPLLKDSKLTEKLGAWATADLLLKSHAVKEKILREGHIPYHTTFVGAGYKNLATLARLKNKWGDKVFKEKVSYQNEVLVVEQGEIVASPFYGRHFRLNSVFFDSEKRDVNYTASLLFQISDTIKNDAYPYSHDVGVITALNYRYLNVPILFQSEVVGLKKPQYPWVAPYQLKIQNEESNFHFLTKKIVYTPGTGVRSYSPYFPEGTKLLLRQSQARPKLAVGDLLDGNTFLKKIYAMPREELNEFLKDKSIAIAGLGHEGMTVIEAITTKVHEHYGIDKIPEGLRVVVYDNWQVKDFNDYLIKAQTGKSEHPPFREWIKKRYEILDFARLRGEVEGAPKQLYFAKTKIRDVMLGDDGLLMPGHVAGQYGPELYDVVVLCSGFEMKSAITNELWQHYVSQTLNMESVMDGYKRVNILSQNDDIYLSINRWNDPKLTATTEYPIPESFSVIGKSGELFADTLYPNR